MKNIYHSPYLWTNHGKSRILQEIEVETRNVDIRFKTGCRNMAVKLYY